MRRAQVPLQKARSRRLGQQGRSLQRSQLPRQPARSLRKLLGAPEVRRRNNLLKTVCQGSYAAALSLVPFSGELRSPPATLTINRAIIRLGVPAGLSCIGGMVDLEWAMMAS